MVSSHYAGPRFFFYFFFDPAPKYQSLGIMNENNLLEVNKSPMVNRLLIPEDPIEQGIIHRFTGEYLVGHFCLIMLLEN